MPRKLWAEKSCIIPTTLFHLASFLYLSPNAEPKSRFLLFLALPTVFLLPEEKFQCCLRAKLPTGNHLLTEMWNVPCWMNEQERRTCARWSKLKWNYVFAFTHTTGGFHSFVLNGTSAVSLMEHSMYKHSLGGFSALIVWWCRWENFLWNVQLVVNSWELPDLNPAASNDSSCCLF